MKKYRIVELWTKLKIIL